MHLPFMFILLWLDGCTFYFFFKRAKVATFKSIYEVLFLVGKNHNVMGESIIYQEVRLF